MYGWRGRIGIIVPSTNTTCEEEYRQIVPYGISIHTARVHNPEAKSEEEKEAAMMRMNQEVERAAREVAGVEPDVIIYACTTGSFLKGPGYDQEVERMVSSRTGIQALTTTTAVVEALRALHLKRIGMATPYTRGIAAREKDFLEQVIPGLKVVSEKNLEMISNLDRGRLLPLTAYRAAREIDTPEVEGIFVSCTNWRTIEVINLLEQDLNKPVVTSNQASVWLALKKMGKTGDKRYGRLFGLEV
ncbi:MAG: maleate cis-trans isomerase [Deltaproteobacteria bacterium]|nr:MAG: maleate cis-trans isomerase [Deltaproteobacteria bacterium]